MRYRRLGKDGPEIPVVGFGTWQIGGGMGREDEEDALRTVRSAVESGLILVDTAEGYRSSEERIGKALTGFDREGYFLSTKVSRDFSPEGVENALHSSLRKLRTDYIDLYQIHRWDETVPVEKSLEAMLKFRDQGKIRYIGVSNFRVEHLKRALAVAPVVSNQINYNMFMRSAEKELIPFCAEAGVGIMGHSTLGKGLLSGKYRKGHRFASDDERSTFELYRGESFEQYLETAETLKAIAERLGRSMIELAIAWVLRTEQVSTALVGMRSPEQIKAPLSAGDLVLDPEVIAEVDAVLDKSGVQRLAPFDSQIV